MAIGELLVEEEDDEGEGEDEETEDDEEEEGAWDLVWQKEYSS